MNPHSPVRTAQRLLLAALATAAIASPAAAQVDDQPAPAAPAMAPAGDRTGLFLSLGRDISIVDGGQSFGMPNLATRIGYRLGRIDVFGMIDYIGGSGVEKQGKCLEYSNETGNCLARVDEEIDLSLLTIGAGGRLFLRTREAQQLAPYVVGGLFFLVPTSKSDSDKFDDLVDDTSSFGLQVGGGLEYFLADQLSIGGELGLTYFTVSSEGDDDLSGSLSQLYSALQVNFYL